MLTDEELIQRLHEGLASLKPRSDLVDELRRQAAADRSRPLRPRMPRRAPRRLGRGIALAAGPLVAVIIAIAALTLAGHHATRPSATKPPASYSPARDLKSLKRDFPFLRRPQTPADRASLPGLDRVETTAVPGMPRVGVQATFVPLRQLTRLVSSQGVTVRVFVVRLDSTRVVPASAATAARVRRFETTLPPYELLGQVQESSCSTRSTTRSRPPSLPHSNGCFRSYPRALQKSAGRGRVCSTPSP